MAAQHAVDEADIRQRVDDAVEAIRAMDVEGLKSIYAPDLVSFDIVHDHVSVPLDVESGRALRDLEP